MSDDIATRRQPRIPVKTVVRLRVAVFKGPDQGQVYSNFKGDRVAVGVSKDNDVALSDPTVSRYHLELFPGRDGIGVRDLGSLNGTMLGGVRLVEGTVPVGARLELGGTVLSLESEGLSSIVDEAPSVPGLVGAGSAMRAVQRAVHKQGPSEIPVLIEGETGTGKELVAAAIHALSPRAGGPFVVVDCASLPASLIASELFGHERGAFTGADRRRAGAFERAHQGTIFLDEIGELPIDVQPVLLGVLERRRFRPVGADKEIAVDVRVVAATNRDLRAEINRTAFRADLYFRLAVGRIVIPPLRERPEDLEPLIEHFTELATGARGNPFDPSTIELLRNNHWSGNVRELRNVVERRLATGETELDPSGAARATEPRPSADLVLYREARAEALRRFERDYLTWLIQQCQGNASEAARRSGMDRPYLLSLLRKHALR